MVKKPSKINLWQHCCLGQVPTMKILIIVILHDRINVIISWENCEECKLPPFLQPFPVLPSPTLIPSFPFLPSKIDINISFPNLLVRLRVQVIVIQNRISPFTKKTYVCSLLIRVLIKVSNILNIQPNSILVWPQ